MRLQTLTALWALLPLALGLNPATLPLDQTPYLLITDFEAFMPFTSTQNMHAWTVFTLSFMHPDMSRRWHTLCTVHTPGALCTPDTWTKCMAVQGPGAVNQTAEPRFSFQGELASVGIMREWDWDGMKGTTFAYEDANWDERVKGGNVTVSMYGKYYKRPAGWIFPERHAVG